MKFYPNALLHLNYFQTRIGNQRILWLGKLLLFHHWNNYESISIFSLTQLSLLMTLGDKVSVWIEAHSCALKNVFMKPLVLGFYKYPYAAFIIADNRISRKFYMTYYQS